MRHKDDNKAQVIREKAIEMIVNEGFDGLSMHKLAKAAGISASTIYVYFESREDLLEKIYIELIEEFENAALKDFDPAMNFREGLWIQWRNRFDVYVDNPIKYYFWEQFRNSPKVNYKREEHSIFKEKMREFYQNAVKRNEVIELPLDIYWSIAYSSLYTLIKFHVQGKDLIGNPYVLTNEILKQAFDLVVKALEPEKNK